MQDIKSEQCWGEFARYRGMAECVGEELRVERSEIEGRYGCGKCLVAMAFTDNLTGLPNRNFIEPTFDILVKAGGPFSIVKIDLENFGYSNKRFGENEGDRLLQHTGKYLLSQIRRTDDAVAVRHGGDEFTLFLPSINRGKEITPEEGAQAATERLVSEFPGYSPIAEYNSRPEVKGFELGMKAGYAVRAVGEDFKTLSKRADPKKPQLTPLGKKAQQQETLPAKPIRFF